MKNKKNSKINERQVCLSEEFLEDVILNRAKGGEYVEISEDFELKPKNNLPIVCGEKMIVFPFGVLKLDFAETTQNVCSFNFFEGELEKIKTKKSEWFDYCGEKNCACSNRVEFKNKISKTPLENMVCEGAEKENIESIGVAVEMVKSKDTLKNTFNNGSGNNENESVCFCAGRFENEINSGKITESEDVAQRNTEKLKNELISDIKKSESNEGFKNLEDVLGDKCKKLEEFKGDTEMVCVKRKVSKKYNAPDMSAVKLLMELKAVKENGMTGLASEIKNMTNEELEKRKKEIMEQIVRG